MQFHIPGCKPEAPKRVHAISIHLTYAGLGTGELNFESILSTARQWGGVRYGLREYMIGREQHEQPTDPNRPEHFHCYFKFGKRVDVRDRLHTTVFDLTGENGRVLHPELQGVGGSAADRENVIKYDMKQNDWRSELIVPLAVDPQRDEATAADEAEDGGDEDAAERKTPGWAKMLNGCTTVKQGMEMLAAKAPAVYYLNGSRIEPMLAKRLPVTAVSIYTLDDFNKPALELDKPTVLYGKTETGAPAPARARRRTAPIAAAFLGPPPVPSVESRLATGRACPRCSAHLSSSSPPLVAGKTAFAKLHFKHPLVVRRKVRRTRPSPPFPFRALPCPSPPFSTPPPPNAAGRPEEDLGRGRRHHLRRHGLQRLVARGDPSSS